MSKIWDCKEIKSISDIKIQVENEIYELHSFVLCVSPFIRILIKSGFIESKLNIIKLTEIEKDIWEIILEFLYKKAEKLLDMYDTKYSNRTSNNIPEISKNILETCKILLALDYLQINGDEFRNRLQKDIKNMFTDSLESINEYWELVFNILNTLNIDTYIFVFLKNNYAIFAKFVTYMHNNRENNIVILNHVFWNKLLLEFYDINNIIDFPFDLVHKLVLLKCPQYKTQIYSLSSCEF